MTTGHIMSYMPSHGQPNFRPHNSQSYNDPGDYWCDTCDKGFRTAFLLENHKKLHQKCNIDGCQFIAHPKVITRHIQMQHSTGLYKKIAKLNDPEEIKKWREERKKKYPTRENIERKAAQLKEKISRGEKMGMQNDRRKRKPFEKDFSSAKKSKSFNNFENRKRKRFSKDEFTNTKAENKKLYDVINIPTEETRTLKPFEGIQNLVFDDEVEETVEAPKSDLIEDDEYVHETHKSDELKPSDPLICGALTSLICNYGSSDEEELDDRKINQNDKNLKTNNERKYLKINTQVNKTSQNNNTSGKDQTEVLIKNENISKEDQDNDSGPEESKIVKEQCDNNVTDKKESQNSQKRFDKSKTIQKCSIKNKSNIRNMYRRKLPSTLLEKLLHKEIQKERNIVLQCVRHIIKNNYFDKTGSN